MRDASKSFLLCISGTKGKRGKKRQREEEGEREREREREIGVSSESGE